MTQILIVDDSPQERYLLEALLSGVGYDVILANNGQEALAIAREASPDLLITDVLMPIMDGFALCRAWMNEPPLRAIPVLIYTATYTDPADEQLAGRLGVTRYLRKPLEPEPLLAIIEEVLAEHTDIAAPQPEMTESSYLKLYNTRLVEKLEEKTQELQERNNFLQEVLGLNPVVIFTLPFHGEHASWISANVSDVLGWEVAEVATAEWWDGVVHPDDRDEVLSRFMDLTGDQEHLEMTYRLRHRDGRYLWIHQQLKITRTAEDNTPDEIFGSWTDVSARVEAEQERELLRNQYLQAQKMEALGTLASGIAHDFNNLLMGMTGCVNAALKHIPERSQAHMFLNEARQAAHQGASLTRQLLAFSRKQPDDPIKIDLNTVIVQNAQIFHSLLGEAIDLQINLESDPAHIWCDEGKIEQILMNLVVNARDAMPQGGVLRVVTRRTPIEPSERERMGLSFDQAITLVVEDTGVGMDEATRERIFEPFFTTKALGKGTGLGLSTVYGIVRQIKGHIDLTSEPGVGTRFTFYLPPYDGQGGDAAETEQQPALRRGTETVLVVEDEPLVRMSVRHFLEHWGYQVIEASDGLSGLNAYHTHARQIALLVTDTVLPRMSGTQLAKRIHEHNPDLPILYMSAHTPEMLLAEGRINASIELLQKPFKEEALIAAISQLLGPEEPGTFASRLADPATLTQDTEAHLTAANSPNAPTDIRVLLIEDYAPVRNASAFLLEDEGFQVLTAESSAEAMEVANVNTVDIVITDINLPDEKGPALVNRLREDNPELSAIYLSGLSMDHPAVQEALSQPDTAFFEKPFKVEALARTIVHMLSNRSDEGERS